MKCNCKLPDNFNDFDIFSLPLDCKATWELIQSGKVKGCFQIESNLGQQWTKKILPNELEHLSALIAIIRPGSLEVIIDGHNMPSHYAKRKNKLEESKPLHEKLKGILTETYEICIYQEQISKIAVELANFNLIEADNLRKAAAKKLPEEMAKVRSLFINKAIEYGKINEDEANIIFDIIEKSQRYSFNKCLSGDTILYRNKNKHSKSFNIAEMYKLSKDIRYAKDINRLSSYKKYKLKKFGKCPSINNGRVKENNIVDIYYQGQQEVYKLTTECGRYIKCTINHKFPTPNGEFELSELQIGDELYYKGEVDLSKTKKYGFSNTTIKELRKLKKEKYNNLGFVKGENNPGYVNGQYTLWQENIKKLPMNCEICGKINCKFEVHHKSGNRLDNSLDNLQRLCISCHKKEEYKAGRTKRGEKGYLLKTTKIKSIEYIGLEDVYDVEMKSPYHTLTVDNGLITSNSHSYSYANYSYISAYIKCHFPLEFFCSWLTYAGDKPKPQLETKQLIQDAKTFDITITNPNLADFEPHCYISSYEDKVIRFGLVDIAGIGQSSFNKLKKIHLKHPLADTNFIQFLVWYGNEINQTTFKALIGSGSLSALSTKNMSRNEMLYCYDKFSKLTKKEISFITDNIELNDSIDGISGLRYILSNVAPLKKEGGGTSNINRKAIVEDLIKLLDNPPHNLQDSVDWIIETEENLLGIALSASRLTAADVGVVANITCKEFLDGGNFSNLILAANIDSTRVFKTKNGKQKGSNMAFLSLSDDSGAVDGVAFPDCWKENARLLTEGRSVMVMGNRDKERNSLIINKVWSL